MIDVQQPPQEYVDARPGPMVELRLPPHRVETVCRLLGMLPPGHVHGCSMLTIGGCLIIIPRVEREITQEDQDAIYRHEKAHCNGWRH